MKTRLIGDIHGNWYEYDILTKNIEHNSIQVGDFGFGFKGPYWEDRANEYHKSGQHRFIRGNHDSPAICKEQNGWIKDGAVESYGDKTVMFIGGAWSIDQQWRIEGESWWPDEQVSDYVFSTIHDIYSTIRPDVMVTHDCPTLAAYKMFIKDGKALAGKALYLTRTGEALQDMFETHQPSHWFFGHWHMTKEYDMLGTHFHCLGIDDYVDFNFETLTYEV